MEIGLAAGFRGPVELTERFEILEFLGDGAAGCVYKVRDRQRNNMVMALKVLADEHAFDEATLDRFLQEIKLCQSIRHPNLVEAYDLIEEGDSVAYTMELVDGGSLQAMFSQRKIGIEAVEKIMDQVLMAVAELHNHGVVHRDIKMENVLLRTDGTVKLTDLGLMKQLGTQGLTKPGLLLGTPQYMPPEYVRRSVYDERGDIYTLGLLLYELVSGKRWLSHLRGQEVINYLVKTRFEINRATLAGVSPKHLEILGRALDHDPALRYQTAGEMRAAFAKATAPAIEPQPRGAEIKAGVSLERYSELARSQTVIVSKRRYLVAIALTFGVLIGILVSTIVIHRRKMALNPAPAPVSTEALELSTQQGLTSDQTSSAAAERNSLPISPKKSKKSDGVER